MFNLFKKRGSHKVGIEHWDVNPGAEYELINNGDSFKDQADSAWAVEYFSSIKHK